MVSLFIFTSYTCIKGYDFAIQLPCRLLSWAEVVHESFSVTYLSSPDLVEGRMVGAVSVQKLMKMTLVSSFLPKILSFDYMVGCLNLLLWCRLWWVIYEKKRARPRWRCTKATTTMKGWGEWMIKIGSCGKNGWDGKELELETTLLTSILTSNLQSVDTN